jgi:hypothetical protein
MMDEKYMPLALDFIEGRLDEKGAAEVQRCIAAGEMDETELKELAALYGKLLPAPIAVPGERMRNRFLDVLAAEQASQTRPSLADRLQEWWQQISFSSFAGQWSLAIGMLLLGIGAGYWLRPEPAYEQQLSQLSTEVQQMRELMMLTMLEQSSPTDRLKAVNMGYELSNADNRVIEALLQTLVSDPNVNVRLAAVEALRMHANQPMVREGLVQAIGQQDAPIVQVAMADLMVELQEKRAVEPMQRLLKEQPLDETVREKLEKSIHILI